VLLSCGGCYRSARGRKTGGWPLVVGSVGVKMVVVSVLLVWMEGIVVVVFGERSLAMEGGGVVEERGVVV